MTRKDELMERAQYIANWANHSKVTADEILEELIRVEREVWEKVAEHCHYMHNDGYTMDDVAGCGNEDDIATAASNDELRAIEKWARAQQQELT